MPLFFIYYVIRFDLAQCGVEVINVLRTTCKTHLVHRNHSNLVTEQFMQIDNMYDSIYHWP